MRLLFLLLSLGLLLPFCATAQSPISGNVTVMQLDAPILEEIQENSTYKSILTDENFSGGRTFYGKLRITVSGAKVKISTRKDFLPSTFVPFDYNVPIFLSSFDLEEYFHPEALDFQGLNLAEYMKSGLPEGSYSLCIEVFDIRRDDRPVSNRSCTSFYVKGNYPPLIISPKGEIPQYEPQNIQFNWAPLHSGSFPVNYTLQVWEKQTGLTDDQIVEQTLPFFQTETSSTSFNYGAEHPLIESGPNYLVRVKIDDVTGRNKFVNEGYSRIETFGYDPCGEGKDFIDSDGDGVCDALDFCPGFNDNIDLDEDGLSDYCDTSQDPMCINKFDIEFGQLVAARLPEGLNAQAIYSITVHDNEELNGTYTGSIRDGVWKTDSRNFASHVFESIISINLYGGEIIAEPCHYNPNGWQITEVVPVATPSTDCTETSFTANWEPVQDAYFYKLYVTTAPDFEMQNRVQGYFGIPIQEPTTSLVVENIDPSLTYYYRVRAHYLNGSKNETDISQMSNRIKVENCLNCESGDICDDEDDCTENDVYDDDCNCAGTLIDENQNGVCDEDDQLQNPVALPATISTNTNWIANWQPSEAIGEYQLDISTDPDFTTYVVGFENLTVNNTSYEITDLDILVSNYYYRVRAVNGDWISENSNVITVEPQFLDTPVATSAGIQGADIWTANWNALDNAEGYLLDISTDSDFSTFVTGYEAFALASDLTSHELTGLDITAQPYYYRLRGVNSFGESDYSNVISVEPTAPNAPVMTDAIDISMTSFTALWTAPISATDILLEVVVVNADGSTSVLPDYDNISVSGGETLISGLTAGFIYQVRAQAVGVFGTSEYSNTLEVPVGMLPEAPVALAAFDVGRTAFVANWQSVPFVSNYNLQLARDFGFTQTVSSYDNISVEGLEQLVSDLENDGESYFYRVNAETEAGVSEWSNIIETELNNSCVFTMPDNIEYACGLPIDETPFGDVPLVTDLNEGDTIIAGDFVIILTQVTGSGPYNGDGYLYIDPFSIELYEGVNDPVRINVDIKQISVNENCRVVDGYGKVTGAGLMLLSEELADQLADIMDVLETIDDVLEIVETVLEEVNEVLNATEGVSDYFSDGWNLLDGTDGILAEYPYIDPAALDSLQASIDCFTSGASPSSCQDELVAAITGLTTALDDMYNANQQILFVANEGQKYGFDTLPYPAIAEHYNTFNIAGSPYNVPWKSVSTDSENNTDVVDAATTDGSSIPSNIRFEDNEKNLIPTSGNTLTVDATANNEIYPVYAVEDHGDSIKLAGKLNVITYDPVAVNIVFVPVNGHSYPSNTAELENKIQSIYDPAVVDISFTYHDNVSMDPAYNVLDTLGSGIFSAYNSEMNAIINDFSLPSYDNENTYYFFLLASSENPNKLGVMPKKRKFGFIFTQANDTDALFAKTVAHELGHGAFILDHPWENYESLKKGDTDNLMDYQGEDAVVLNKYQWHIIHNPEFHATLFDSDEEGENFGVANIEYFRDLDFGMNGDSTFTFITPAGQFLQLPNDVKGVYFDYGLYESTINTGFDVFLHEIPGALTTFNVGGKRYDAKFEDISNTTDPNVQFIGYVDSSGASYTTSPEYLNTDFYNYGKGMFLRFYEDRMEIHKVEATFDMHEDNSPATTVLNFPQLMYPSDSNREIIDYNNNTHGTDQDVFNSDLLTLVFKDFTESDDTHLIRAKVSEIAHAYGELFTNVSCSHYGVWNCSEMANGFLASFEEQYKQLYCDCNTTEVSTSPGPGQNTETCSENTDAPENLLLKFTEYYEHLVEEVRNGAVDNNVDLNILTTASIAIMPLGDLLETLSEASPNEISFYLDGEEVLFIISRLVNLVSTWENTGGVCFSYTLGPEEAIVKILDHANPEESREILEGIEGANKIYPTRWLAKDLFFSVDDKIAGIFGEDNRLNLMNSLMELWSADSTFYKERHAEFTDLTNHAQRTYLFEHQNVVKRIAIQSLVDPLGDGISYVVSEGLSDLLGIPSKQDLINTYYSYSSLNAKFVEEPTNEIELEEIDIAGLQIIDKQDPPTRLDPFDVVFLINESNLNTLKSLDARGLMPAYLAAYIAETGQDETFRQSVYTTLDVLSLSVGLGTLNAANGVRHWLILSDIASSGASLAATATADCEECNDIRNALNIYSGVTGIAVIGGSIANTWKTTALDNLNTGSNTPVLSRTQYPTDKELITVNANYALPTSRMMPDDATLWNSIDGILNTSKPDIRTWAAQYPQKMSDLTAWLSRLVLDAKRASHADDVTPAQKAVFDNLAAETGVALNRIFSALQDPDVFLTAFGQLDNFTPVIPAISSTRADNLAGLSGSHSLLSIDVVNSVNNLGNFRSEFFDNLLMIVDDANHISKHIDELTSEIITSYYLFRSVLDELVTDFPTLKKLGDDIVNNPTLTSAFESDAVLLNLWKDGKWSVISGNNTITNKEAFLKTWKKIIIEERIRGHVYHGDVVITIKVGGNIYPGFPKKIKATYFLSQTSGNGGLIDEAPLFQTILQNNPNLIDNIKHNLKSNQLNAETDVIHLTLTGLHGGQYLDPINANIFGQPGNTVTYLSRPNTGGSQYNPDPNVMPPVITTNTVVGNQIGIDFNDGTKAINVAPAVTKVLDKDGWIELMTNGTISDVSDTQKLIWLKKGNNSAGLASLYPEGIPLNEMEELVAMAFSDAGKVWISPGQWRSTIVFKERLTTFQGFGTQGSGGVDTDVLSTGFIIGVE